MFEYWKDEETPQETYNHIMGYMYIENDEELLKVIDKDLEDPNLSKYERNGLLNLRNRLVNF